MFWHLYDVTQAFGLKAIIELFHVCKHETFMACFMILHHFVLQMSQLVSVLSLAYQLSEPNECIKPINGHSLVYNSNKVKSNIVIQSTTVP